MLTFPGNILIADHHGGLDKFLCTVIDQDQWAVHRVDSLEELKLSLGKMRPDIIVLNAHLPEMSIMAFCNDLRIQYGEQTPYVMLAIFHHPEDTLKLGYKAGVDDFLIVPFYAIEVITKIKNFVKRMQVPAPALVEPPVSQEPPAPVEAQAPVIVEPPVTQEPDEPQQAQILPVPTTPPPNPSKRAIKARKKGTVIPLFSRDVAIKLPDVPKAAPPRSINAPLPMTPPIPIPERPRESAAGKTLTRKNMTVLAIRIDRLERHVDEMDPLLAQQCLAKIYADITGDVERFTGKMIYAQGNTLVAVFQKQHHRLQAVKAALQIELSSLFFGEKYVGDPRSDLDVAIALHSGMLTISNIDELGLIPAQSAGGPLVSGTALNMALRILERVRPGDIIASSEILAGIRRLLLFDSERALVLDRAEERVVEIANIRGLNLGRSVKHATDESEADQFDFKMPIAC